MKYVQCVFDSNGRQYSYLCDDNDVKVGDYYVVYPREFPAVVKIVGVSNLASGTATIFVGERVDRAAYEKKAEKANKIAKLQSDLSKRKTEIDEGRINERYAEVDKTFSKIYRELRELIS